ncbi:MAG: hypothetical protein J7M26_02775 [Armatimonadetes bacterium]|nr:hypothetical protein [Armatimonadota bacterium]
MVPPAPADGSVRVHRVTVRGALAYERPPEVNLCPTLSAPARRPRRPQPTCRREGSSLVLGDGFLTARFAVKPGLTLKSLELGYRARPLYNAGKQGSGKAHGGNLFLLEVGDRRYGSGDFKVVSVTTTKKPAGFSARLALPQPHLEALFSARLAGQGKLSLSLKLTNRSQRQVQVKTAFPYLTSLDAEYYLFPYHGGIIANLPTYLRTAYGENTAWWQMIDVFSPADGCGLYVHVQDEAGAYKCPVLRKGGHCEGDYGYDRVGLYMDPALLWQHSLPPAPGVSLTFEYLRRTLAPGQSLQWAPTLLAAHEGDWHQAMSEYSRWAHRVWKWRPYPGALADRWNVTAPGWGQKPLVSKEGWRTDYLTEDCDIAEMMSWWEWSDLGPWRVPMDMERLPKLLGEPFFKRYKAYWVVDPIAGRLRYPLNRGDYNYNETWGGLTAFRAHIDKVKSEGVMAGVYIDGILACDTTEVGHKYGPIYGVMNPYWKDGLKCPLSPEGYVAAYGSWNMCCDTEWWADRLSHTVARIFRDTGIDYLRLDEFGHRGYPCFSTKHKHMFAPEPGHNAWLQGCAEICRRTHRLMDQIRPGLALTTEFPGNDHMAANLDGSIVYEVGYHALPIRPVVCNLLRFYFPECKPFDLDYKHTPHGEEVKLWNGMGAFGNRYSLRYLRLLRHHTDIFGRGTSEPLLPTLVPQVYCNRFAGGDKQVLALINARPYPVEGLLVVVDKRQGRHFVELLRGLELTPQKYEGRWAIGLRLEPGELALIADLPALAEARVVGGRAHVRLAQPQAATRVVLLDMDGAALAEAAAARQATLDLPRDLLGKTAVVAVYSGKYVADLVPLR